MNDLTIKEEWFQALRKIHSYNAPIFEKLQRLNLKQLRYSNVKDLEDQLKQHLSKDAEISKELSLFLGVATPASASVDENTVGNSEASHECQWPRGLILLPPSKNETVLMCDTKLLQFQILSNVEVEDYLQLRWEDDATSTIAQNYSKHVQSLSLKMHEAYTPYERSKEVLEVAPVGTCLQLPTVMYGRLISETENRFNENTILLEGSLEFSDGATMPLLGLKELPKLCLFSGQTVGVIGMGIQDEHSVNLSVQEILEGLPLNIPKLPRAILSDHLKNYSSRTIRIYCGSAQYLTSATAWTRLEQEPPNILIVFGPLVEVAPDTEVPASQSADIYVQYRSRLNAISAMGHKLKDTKIVVLPHIYDVGHPFPLPQPPFLLSLLKFNTNKLPSNVYLIGNPGQFKLNDLHIAVTSCDPLSAIQDHCVCKPISHKNILICQQILKQRSLFPAYPMEYPVHSHFLSKLGFDEVPNIFIFPSKIEETPFALKIFSRVFVSAFTPKRFEDCITCIEINPPHLGRWDSESHNEEDAVDCALDLPSRISIRCSK